jgi:beta-carotene ketolase (CrtW type)
MAVTTPALDEPRRQAAIGLSLAALIVVAWCVTHICGVFLFRLERDPAVWVPVLMALQCWLNVGLFIVAHDAMHGSLAPFRPRLNRAVGRLCLALYAGFSYDRLIGKHFDHHRFAGTERDPDFHAEGPRGFWRWYLAFMRCYFGWREFAVLTALLALYLGVFRVRPENALLFWGLPAILSSLQLFYFGTYLPHRHEDEGFADSHNARSNEFSWSLSLLTCFHFGYHHEHHDQPRVPWWRLPGVRRPGASA